MLAFQASYTLNIVATDDNSVDSLRSSTHVLTVSVTDENDVTPHFNPVTYVTTISESPNVGDSVISVTATDEDDGSYGTFSYSIVSSTNTGSAFKIGSTGMSP